jgi:phage anti-repressor protein
MDLIKLSDTNQAFPVDSRDLHKVLEVKSEHYHWISRRLNDLEENSDYHVTDDVSGEKIYSLTEDAAKHFALMEKNEKGKMVRQWFIEREKVASRPMSPTELALWSAQKLVDQERALKAQDERLSKVEKAVSYESIHQMVQDSLVEETINEFPRECVKLEMIRETVFNDISEAVISKYLSHVKHPTKEYKFKMDDNILRSITVFETRGLVDVYNRFRA